MTIWHVIYVCQGVSAVVDRQNLFFDSLEVADTEGVKFLGGVSQPWSYPDWESIPVTRTSRDLGDPLRKPFIKDLLALAADRAEADDWLLYTNGDCSVVESFYRDLHALSAAAVEYQRLDVDDDPANLAELFGNARAPYEPGIDGIALRAGFFREFEAVLPDFIIGEPWWDPAYSWILRELTPVRRIAGQLYHPKHPQVWDVENASPAGLHNYGLMKRALEGGHVRELTLYDREEATDTAIVSCLFGNCERRLAACLEGLSRQLQQGLYADHYVVELLEEGQESRLPADLLDRVRHVPVLGTARNADLFQKESLLNLGWRHALEQQDYAYFVFTDADVFAEDGSWFRQIRARLQEQPNRAVHGYRVAQDSVDPAFSFGSLGSVFSLDEQTDLPLNPGLVWGLHRRMLEAGDGLNPFCLECAGDSALVVEYLNQPGAEYEMLFEWPWYREIHRQLPIRAILDAVPVDITHVNHGPAAERNYDGVRRALSQMRPIFELVEKDERGLLAWIDPDCLERRILTRRGELTSKDQIASVFEELGLAPLERKLVPFECVRRDAPEWPSETPPLLRDGFDPTEAANGSSRYVVFSPSRIFRADFPASWCDNVVRVEDSRYIPMTQRDEVSRLVLDGLPDAGYVIGIAALQPNWVPVDMSSFASLHLSVHARGSFDGVSVWLVGQDEAGEEHDSREVSLTDLGLVFDTDQEFRIPLEAFAGEAPFDLERVRTVKVVGHGGRYLELFEIYFRPGE